MWLQTVQTTPLELGTEELALELALVYLVSAFHSLTCLGNCKYFSSGNTTVLLSSLLYLAL